MSKKIMGNVLLVLGVLLLLVTPTADITGLGHTPGFGWVQISGTMSGLAAILLGYSISKA